jgi:23S rRNA pseudouridine2605 synthase
VNASADWGNEGTDEGTGDRLQKVLARAGFGSRRACDDLIAAGRVEVNGEVARLGRRVDPETDHIRVDSVDVSIRPGLVHYLLNKPAGMVSTASDPEGRPTVISAVPPEPRVHSVGRLDAATEGLLVLTNDGDLTFRLTHPRYGVEKEYLAELASRPRPAALRALREGVELDDGPTAPAKVAQVGDRGLRIVIHEGRNRQVRRMCDAVGHPVVRLARIRIGPLADRRLAPGEWRSLTADEVRALEQTAAQVGPPGATRAERRAAERRANEQSAGEPRANEGAATKQTPGRARPPSARRESGKGDPAGR